MKTDVAGFDQEHERGSNQQPTCSGDSMYVDDLGYSRLLMEIVVQIEAETDAYEGPEDGEPDKCSLAIFTCGPGCK